jgi:hypothetical protein
MDRSTEWPWSWEQEAEWKAELEEEERDKDFLDELIDSWLEEGATGLRYVLESPQEEEPEQDGSPQKYSITA